MGFLMRFAVRLTLLVRLLVPVLAGEEHGCPVFVLQREESGLVIEQHEVPSGEVKVFTGGSATGVVGVVLPPGPGGSGGLINLDEENLQIVQCDGETVRWQIRDNTGETLIDYPGRSLEDLRQYDIRVSVAGGGGILKAFLITAYREVQDDPGPVQNLLAQAGLPKGENQFVVTTDTYLHAVGAPVYGEFQVELAGHPFAKVKRHDGEEVWFLVDIGAAETLVERSFVPEGLAVKKSHRVEYSGAGRRLLDYAPGGATGTVGGIQGHADLPDFQVGEMHFPNVSVAVIEEMPELFDRPVSGIIGMDLLRRPERLLLRFPPDARGSGTFVLAGPSSERESGSGFLGEVPFSIVSSHLLVSAEVNTTDFYFILDSGAPRVLLDGPSAELAAISTSATPARKLGGLDGNKIDSFEGRIQKLKLGEVGFEAIPCSIAPLKVFASLRGQSQPIGLLGNSFFGRFDRVELDFIERRLRVYGPPDAQITARSEEAR
ncbi:MAG: aspartyl protease family protein [Acidobacteriota bacterium]|nr:MAG: aspartyl protease family protein [Acidobacteriota bacterium]